MKNDKGITLTVLIITIIVMLILTTVTINFATNGKIIEKAEEAITTYQLHVFEEELEIYHSKMELKNSDDDYRPEGLYAYYDKIVYISDSHIVKTDENKNIYDILESLRGSKYDYENNRLNGNEYGIFIKEGKISFEPGDIQ